MAHPLWSVVVCFFYFCLRFLVHAARDVIWAMNGTRKLVRESRKEDNYETSAHVLTIIGRYRYDSVVLAARTSDFILNHDGFTHPDYILRDEVTLYHINKTEAVFVECDDGDSPWRLDDHSFSRDGQYSKARRLIILPLYAAYHLADSMGSANREKLIFIGNISRCGSTLLSHLFEKTGQYISYSEPGPISDLINHTDIDDERSRHHVEATLKLMCKSPMLGSPVEGHVIKIMAMVTCILPMLHKVFPHASYVYLYRDHVTSMKSLASLLPLLPFATFQRLLNKWSPPCARRHAIYQKIVKSDQSVEQFNLDVKTPNSFVITKILAPTFVFHQCLRAGFHIPAFKYEDLMEKPTDTLRAIFQHCGVSTHYVAPATKALHFDSQEQSMLSQQNTTQRKTVVFSQSDLDLIKNMCSQNGVPNLLEHPILPETVYV